MASFDADQEFGHDRACRLLMNTSVTLFWRQGLLEETLAWLSSHGYQVCPLDAQAWLTDADLHRDISTALAFPDYYGRNLDALNDCMRDVVAQDYGWVSGTAGLVVAFINYDVFASRSPRTAQIVLDIMADHSRVTSLFGRRLVTLVHSNNPGISFDPVGATPVMWNEREWLDSARQSD